MPSVAEGRLNQLTPSIVSTSVATLGKSFTCIGSGLLSLFSLNWWINRVPAITMAGVRVGDAACAGWHVTLCDHIWHAGSLSGAVLLSSTYLWNV